MNSETFPLPVVQHALRVGLPFLAIASIVLAAGITSIVLSRLRSRDRLLLWLGVFAILYGLRLLAENDLVTRAAGIGHEPFELCRILLTYLIPIPYALFVRELLGAGWKRSLTIWLWVEIAFAPLAIPLAIFGNQLRCTDLVNGIFVVGGTLLTVAHIAALPSGAETAALGLKWPLVTLGIAVLLTNFGFKPSGIDIEPIGFLILLGGLGYTASLRALRRERKLTEVEQELATARRIQASILPKAAPQVPALRIATRYQPMTAVAGDFYDFLRVGENSLTILVADVSGHGVPAALVASMLKICFAAQRNQARDPAKVLNGLNVMLRDVVGGQYVTAACAVIDLSAGTVTYAGAGHPPALLLRGNGTDLVQLAENGLFIGPFPQATYTSISVPFASGDRLVLYTDGIVEAAATDGQEFGRERLAELLFATKSLEPDDLIEHLFARIRNSPQEDDLTVVIAEFE